MGKFKIMPINALLQVRTCSTVIWFSYPYNCY